MQRILRLHHRADFERLRAVGRTWRTPILALNAASNTLDHNRYGFIVGKKVGGAVVRNRVRRQLRAAIRTAHEQLMPGYDMIWIARNEIAGKSYQQISATVIELVTAARLLKAEGEP